MALSMVTNGYTEGEEVIQIWNEIRKSATAQLKSQDSDDMTYLVEPIQILLGAF